MIGDARRSDGAPVEVWGIGCILVVLLVLAVRRRHGLLHHVLLLSQLLLRELFLLLLQLGHLLLSQLLHVLHWLLPFWSTFFHLLLLELLS